MSADRRSRAPRALAGYVEKLTRPALRGFGRDEAALLLDWEAIVGPEVGARTQPLKLSFPKRGERRHATLQLRVDPALALDLQHGADLLAERINAHFGYSLVARLRLTQGPVSPRARRRPLRPPPPLPPERAQALDARLQGIEDESLRAALERLATAVAGKERG